MQRLVSRIIVHAALMLTCCLLFNSMNNDSIHSSDAHVLSLNSDEVTVGGSGRSGDSGGSGIYCAVDFCVATKWYSAVDS